jgi:phospholipase C
VRSGNLPAVSWLVAPEKFSDHPTAPWYGAWYVAETLDILTRDPTVWKKTIFILTYDENDGYFDHVPPFVAPDPNNPETGKVSPGIDAALEYLPLDQDLKRAPAEDARGGPIGLGFRVPLVIASPWSRGGFVCSQVFDHTSVLQLLERVMGRRAKGGLEETNISAWRRSVCGDLTVAFVPARPEPAARVKFPKKVEFLTDVHKAQFKPVPAGFGKLSPRQEPGTRPSRALPYEIHADGRLSADRQALELTLEAANTIFGKTAAGVPFHVYTPGLYGGRTEGRTRAYAAAAGSRISDAWRLEGFPDRKYHLRVCGPNGFLRELAGDTTDPLIDFHCRYLLNGDIELTAISKLDRACKVQVKDNAYGGGDHSLEVAAGASGKLVLGLRRSFCWYDFSVSLVDHDTFLRRYAGRVETGKAGLSDPAMGRV